VFAALFAVCLVLVAGHAWADALDDAIASAKEALKKNDGAKTIELMKEIAKSDDPRAVKLLVGLSDHDDEVIACAAYQLVAPKKDPSFLGVLRTRAGNEKIAESAPIRFVAILDALRIYADKTALPVLEDVFARYRGSKPDLAVAAARAYAAVHTKPVVEQMIKWLLDCESVAPYPSSKYQGAAPSKETQAALAKCHEQLVKDLQAMTGQQFTEHKQWKSWWKDAERSFKFPAPPAK
jgi:hypothetical protein